MRRQDDESGLIAKALGGDVHSWEALYRSHGPWVHGLCRRMLSDAEAAEAATQDTFVRAWRKLHQFAGRGSFRGWLRRIAANVALASLGSGAQRPLTEPYEESAGPSSRSDLAMDLEQAIAELPPGARAAFVLHDIEGYKHREIAAMTGTVPGTVKAQLHRARKLLRAALDPASVVGERQDDEPRSG